MDARVKAKRKTSAPAWPADKVERRSVSSLVGYAQNPRLHSEAQVTQIARSVSEFGWTMPCLIDEDGILIAGHGRVLAARQLGLRDVPVMVARGWTDEQRRAYRIADNQLTLASSWNEELLASELGELKLVDYDLSLTGFDANQLVSFLASGEPNPAAEEAPELLPEPVSRRGDLGVLGEHRLLCGDATVAKDVARVCGNDKCALMNTDPPYGVNYGDIANSRSRAASVRKGGNGKNYSTHRDKEIENDDLDGAELQTFLEKAIRSSLPHLIDNPAFYLWHPMLTQGTFFAAAAAAADILIHRQIIWVKPSLIMGRGDYHWRHELCFYGWIKGKRCEWFSGRDQDTVWQIGRENDNIHPTQKPVELFRRPILNHTRAGDAVYEPFSGSGTQIIAAEITERRCLSIELDPRYTDVAVRRFEQFTGKKAKLDGKRGFDAVAAVRAKQAA